MKEKKKELMIENRFHVFDYDGTIEYKGGVSKKNLDFIDAIKNKVLNTSRSLDEIPKFIADRFNFIMTLNGSKLYRDGNLVAKYKKMPQRDIVSAVKFASKNGYNISFNSTKTNFCNVKNIKSKIFMKNHNIEFTEEIIIPDNVYQIVISSNEFVKDFHGATRQSKRFIEISENSKANIANHFNNFIAYGDNNNDIPMFEKSSKFVWVNNGVLKDVE